MLSTGCSARTSSAPGRAGAIRAPVLPAATAGSADAAAGTPRGDVRLGAVWWLREVWWVRKVRWVEADGLGELGGEVCPER